MSPTLGTKLKVIFLYTFISAFVVGLICALAAGFAFQIWDSFGAVVSLGPTPEQSRQAFMHGAAKGGLYGGLFGGFFGGLFGISVAVFRKPPE